jgi:hypothetical protein
MKMFKEELIRFKGNIGLYRNQTGRWQGLPRWELPKAMPSASFYGKKSLLLQVSLDITVRL